MRLTEPLQLLEQGYWCVPLFDRRKYSTQIGGRDWGDYFEAPELGHSELLARAAMVGDTASGWALILQPTDPVKLVVIDSDSYGISAEQAWSDFGLSDVAMPPYVRSASGGHHFWFRWSSNEMQADPNASINRLPSKFTLPAVRGDIRASNAPRLLIVLPGTRAVGHQKKVGTYTASPGFPSVDKLPPFPKHLYRRLTFNETKPTERPIDGERQLPTEATHFLDLLGKDAFAMGAMNIDVAKAGQVLGRCLGWKTPSDKAFADAWLAIKPLLDDDFDDRSFRTAFASGWKRGAANRQAHGAATDIPVATEVMDEAVRLFGGLPSMVEVLDSAGKTHEFILSIGGSDHKPGGRTCGLPKVEDAVEALTRLSGAELDVVTQSPLFVLGKWRKALHFTLMVNRTIDTLGISPEEAVWERLRALARGAASSGNITNTWRGKYPVSDAFIVASQESTDSLALRPRAYEALLLTSGDVTKARRVVKARSVEKAMTGTKAKLYCFSLSDIQRESADPGLLDYVGAEVVRMITRAATKEIPDKS